MSENEKIDTSNIFEDFNDDKSLSEEIESIEIEANKDSVYYMGLVGNIFKYINFTLFLFLIISFLYLFIQKSEGNNFYEKAFLSPFCEVLLGDAQNFEEDYCSGVNTLLKKYEVKLENEKEVTLINLFPVLKDVYSINNFINSEKVSFVISKTKTKINPIEILSEFDILKNSFLSLDKTQIVCNSIIIKGDTFNADCSAFTSYWDSSIPGFSGETGTANTLGGTSISLASSFLNFIEKSEDSKFKLLDKQKIFTAEKLVGEAGYIYRTNFKIKLSYKEANLSL